ncbi:hypothetical protein NHX12_028941 [Muraenolepis orangiensis]|uniref:Uncharacterized protein n=1 Tax=Muraenolepis orangiensis TaxID=630683 RepID=A0A9Q0EBH8_9TELE|nr:hypothetical protein NHX12_028941 [Muraenolepis orangiensis]
MSDRQASDRQAADRQAADRQAADRQAADRQASDRQAADRVTPGGGQTEGLSCLRGPGLHRPPAALLLRPPAESPPTASEPET